MYDSKEEYMDYAWIARNSSIPFEIETDQLKELSGYPAINPFRRACEPIQPETWIQKAGTMGRGQSRNENK